MRHPQGKPIHKVLAAGATLSRFDAGSVTLRTPEQPVTLDLRFE